VEGVPDAEVQRDAGCFRLIQLEIQIRIGLQDDAVVLEDQATRDVGRDDIDAEIASDARLFGLFDNGLGLFSEDAYVVPAELRAGTARIPAARAQNLTRLCLVIGWITFFRLCFVVCRGGSGGFSKSSATG
jgi:hypothetical protein